MREKIINILPIHNDILYIIINYTYYVGGLNASQTNKLKVELEYNHDYSSFKLMPNQYIIKALNDINFKQSDSNQVIINTIKHYKWWPIHKFTGHSFNQIVYYNGMSYYFKVDAPFQFNYSIYGIDPKILDFKACRKLISVLDANKKEKIIDPIGTPLFHDIVEYSDKGCVPGNYELIVKKCTLSTRYSHKYNDKYYWFRYYPYEWKKIDPYERRDDVDRDDISINIFCDFKSTRYGKQQINYDYI
jgi:hypothetical protein